MMMLELKISREIFDLIHRDLSRPHPYASERVGFLFCGAAHLAHNGVQFLSQEYKTVADADYIEDPSVGARIGPTAFRAALRRAYMRPLSVFHVHRHEHAGVPSYSSVDLESSRQFVPDFWNVRPSHPHGTVLLSKTHIRSLVWLPFHANPVPMQRVRIIGPRRSEHVVH